VLDFGLARMAAGQTMLTNTGQVLGTLDFLAPEQAHDARHVDARSDQYSLGCTLYFLLTGSPPFSGPAYDTPASKLKAHLIDHPTPISELRHRVPLALSAVLDRMLAKNPKDRFASLIEVAESLGPLCRGAELATLVGGTGTAFHKHRKAAGGWSGTEFLDRAASVLGWALRGGYRRSAAVDGPKHSHRPQIFSLSGLVVLGFLAFVLSRVSCVEIKEEGPAGTGGTPEEARIIEFGFGNSTPPPAFPFRPVQPNQTTDKTGQNGR